MSDASTTDGPRVVLTDPAPLPRDARCPQCLEPPSRRVLSAGFGAPHEVCGKCGYAFPPEEDERG